MIKPVLNSEITRLILIYKITESSDHLIMQWRIQDFLEGVPIPVRGRQPIIWLIFLENYMKIKKF